MPALLEELRRVYIAPTAERQAAEAAARRRKPERARRFLFWGPRRWRLFGYLQVCFRWVRRLWSRVVGWMRGPLHEVEISRGFWLGRYEVTQGQWEAVMGETPWSGKSYVRSNPSHPAVYISWHDVQEFIEKLNAASGSSVYRLPSEAEWEYACRAGTTTRWSFGDDVSQLTDYAWYGGNACTGGECYARVVGKKRPNPWKLHDMHGNVFEWVQDWYSSRYYNSSPRVDPSRPIYWLLPHHSGWSFP